MTAGNDTSATARFNVWVWDESGLEWFEYTRQPFETEEAAFAWAKRYIPDARVAAWPCGVTRPSPAVKGRKHYA